MMSFNAYFGAMPIVDALQKGAQIVVTGRCADSALVLGPLMYEFGWKATDYDLLSAGSLAGHIIECACQATGGNFTDWKKSLAGRPDVEDDEEVTDNTWIDVGYPVVECSADGSFVVTKPEGTGGLVSKATVAEQMLYEIHNPASYILPDVICNWQHVTIMQNEGELNRVKVYGAKGLAPTPYYKISATSMDGYKLDGMLVIGGFDARKKALAVGQAILARASRILALRGMPDFTATNIEVLGAEHTYGPHANEAVRQSREVVLRIGVHHHDVMALGIFGREVAPAATSMAPGITGGGSGRPRPQPLVRHSAVLVKKESVPVTVHVGDSRPATQCYIHSAYTTQLPPPFTSPDTPLNLLVPASIETIVVPLVKLCCGRSGDKGDVANIGIFTRKKEYYPLVKTVLTEQAVASYMGHTVKGKVKRFEVPGIQGLNFVLTEALGGGGLGSLNIDRQGKAYAQMLLSFPVTVPKAWFPANAAKL